MRIGTLNTVIAAAGVAIGVITSVAAVGVVFTPQQPMPTPIIQKLKIKDPECIGALEAMKYEASSVGQDKIKVHERLGSDVYSQLLKVSLAEQTCKKKLSEFCMGDGCENPGITFTLSE